MNDKRISNYLHSSGFLGKKPIIGFSMFIFGTLVFIVLAYNLVVQGPLIKWDLFIANSLYTIAQNSSPFIINIMIIGYYIGLQGIAILAIILGLYFLYKRFWREFVMTAASIGISGLIFLLLSHIFMRPRPFLSFDNPIWSGSPNIPGFPSGHTLNIVVFCGLLVYLLMPNIKSYFGKALVIITSLLLIIYIGFSRLFLGDHYLTDVIAGYAVGIAWLGLTLTSVELLFKKYDENKRN